MLSDASWWLLFNFLSIIFLAFFSMEEMACISFNKIRLQFYVSQGSKRANWLYKLMQNPSHLFGTTLIGVNIATFVGSECSRQFHESLGLNPDLAPLTQVVVVIILGELAPQFAARSYPEHVALLGAPLLYLSSVLLTPLIWILGFASRVTNYLIGGKEPHPDLFLTLDELQKIVESQEDEPIKTIDSEDVNVIASNIFRLRGKTAKSAMANLETILLIPANATIAQAHKFFNPNLTYIPLYHKEKTNIVGIAFVRDLIKASFTKKVREFSRPPWFITENTPLLQILKQFRRNNENVSIVLDERGQSKGILSLDDILREIFGDKTRAFLPQNQGIIFDRTLAGSMTIQEFNKQFSANLAFEGNETLGEMLLILLEHTPEKGESIWIPPYEFTIKETTLLEIKSISVKTKI